MRGLSTTIAPFDGGMKGSFLYKIYLDAGIQRELFYRINGSFRALKQDQTMNSSSRIAVLLSRAEVRRDQNTISGTSRRQSITLMAVRLNRKVWLPVSVL